MKKRFLQTCVIGLMVLPLLASSWSPTGSMRTARYDFGATVLENGKVLAVGGGASDVVPAQMTAEIYDPSTGSWTPTGSMLTPRSAFGMVKLLTGKILVVGGKSFYGLPFELAPKNWTGI